MKTAVKNLGKFLLVIMSFVLIDSCGSDSVLGPNEIGGETNLELTKVGNVSTANMTFAGKALPAGTMTVKSSDGGIVNYVLQFSLKGSKDSFLLANLMPSEYKDSKGNVSIDMKLKITSEGVQDYFRHTRPWTIAKYSDGVGAEYEYTTDNGTKITRKIIEKTGLDDFPMGNLLVKTSKVEQVFPASDKSVSKAVYRVNHKFGLIYVDMLLKTGQWVNISIFPKFML